MTSIALSVLPELPTLELDGRTRCVVDALIGRHIAKTVQSRAGIMKTTVSCATKGPLFLLRCIRCYLYLRHMTLCLESSLRIAVLSYPGNYRLRTTIHAASSLVLADGSTDT